MATKFNSKKSLLWALLCFLVTLSACKTAKTESAVQPIKSTNPVEKVNHFSASLFAGVCGEDKGNVFLSPLSADIALSMVQQGARGTTLQEMDAWFAPLQIVDDDQLKAANSLWIETDFPVKEDFLMACKPFKADVFNQHIVPNDVNKWVSSRTNGKIPTILQNPLPARLSMVLVNAIYFKADWVNEFEGYATRSKLFFPQDVEPHDIMMMHQTAHFNYAQTKDAQLIELPYQGGRYAMDIILPNKEISAREYARKFNIGLLKEFNKMASVRVALTLPKFKIEYSRSLGDDLKAMGVRVAFTDDANFSGISDVRTHIDAVLQKTYINVNETGTEAAAATAVIMTRSTAFRPEKPIEMKINRPFILLIRNIETGTIVFIGKIEDIAKS